MPRHPHRHAVGAVIDHANSVTNRVYIGIGSNLAEPVQQVKAGFNALAGLPQTTLLQTSRLYGNPPMGPVPQPDYVNAVAAIDTGYAPDVLLQALKAIENQAGRDLNGQRWGPRPLDLDILLYGDSQYRSDTLSIPHPGMPERAFVLYPLAEIAPELMIPGMGLLSDLIKKVDGSGMVPIEG
ncbi:MAG: 2-amino-4-hydroxy-6-hydroxymethyldihydropteridine diphosphokinase [Gammaproteobacteria bacterium]|nr:2-amino-4-hydroxy-6-hydroxymethyldihydropteridine diphosphokinase [Gammaproteobacteria bacterium]